MSVADAAPTQSPYPTRWTRGSRALRVPASPSTSDRPSGSRRCSGARWRSAGRKPVHQMIASHATTRPSSHATPSGTRWLNIGSASRTPRERASRTDATMTMSPSPPTPLCSRPSRCACTRAVAVSNSTRPSTSSARNRGGRWVTHVVSATVDTSARICAAELPPPTTTTRRPRKSSGRWYDDACSWVPVKSPIPRYDGQNGWSQVPVADTTRLAAIVEVGAPRRGGAPTGRRLLVVRP